MYYIFFNKLFDNEGKNYWGWFERKVVRMYINKNFIVMV